MKKKGKTIWIINDYAGSIHHGMEFRHYYLAKQWIQRGYKVYIVSASYSHLFKKLPKTSKIKIYTLENLDGINYLWLKVPRYKNSRDIKRIFKWLIFTLELFFLPLKKLSKPNVIIASPMAPFLAFPAYKLAKNFNAKFIFEVKDIWPLTLIELGDISPKNPLIKLMKWAETFALTRADAIVSALPNYNEYLQDFYPYLNKEAIWISNGICIEDYTNIVNLPISILNKIPHDKFIVGYTGNIGLANALEYLLEAAKLLVGNPQIHFLIVGTGDDKERLRKLYNNLPNVTFMDAIKKQFIPALLKYFDICYIGWRRKNIYKYGISANKLFDYMMAGKPIVHSFSGKGDLVKLAQCGITVEAENPKAIAEAIVKLYKLLPEERKKIGLRGKKFVLENLTYNKLAQKYEKLF